MTRPKARSNANDTGSAEDVVMQDAPAGDSGAAAAPHRSAAMQRAGELTQRRVNLEQKLRDIDHMVRRSDSRHLVFTW